MVSFLRCTRPTLTRENVVNYDYVNKAQFSRDLRGTHFTAYVIVRVK